MQIEHSHTLTHDDAKARARALAEYLSNRHGMQIDWKSDDAFSMRGKYMIVAIDVNVRVEADKVHVTGKDPGMLWRGKAKSYIEHKLTRYLDPTSPLDTLPRS